MTYQCAGCGDDICCNHAVRDGERYCHDCKPVLADQSDESSTSGSVKEYNDRRRSFVTTATLMNGGQVR